MKLSYQNYKKVCDEAFSVNMHNPTIYWNEEDGFYVAPSKNLVPNNDFCLGEAYYGLNGGGGRNFRGTRREYEPIARGLRNFKKSTPEERKNVFEEVRYCRGFSEETGPCGEGVDFDTDGTCNRCGHKNELERTVWMKTIQDFIDESRMDGE